jgi:cytochrome o ubiquinol oxidase operon protein cyoD
MSARDHAAHDHAGHHRAGHDSHAHDDGAAHGSLKGYLTGFGLSVILTAIPFWLVMTGAIDNKQATALIVMALAAVQIVVHMIFFLHMNATAEGGWSILALIFTLVILGIVLTGSLWVMYHLNANMMPSMQDMREMP